MAHWQGRHAKTLDYGGGSRFKSGGLHKILNNTQTNSRVPRGSPRLGHVAPHNFPNTMPHVTNIFAQNLPINECHITTCHVSVRSYDPATSAFTDCIVSIPFFACLTIRTDRNISCSRRSFEMKQVVLGSQRRGLCTH
jgi:hypothetical protein